MREMKFLESDQDEIEFIREYTKTLKQYFGHIGKLFRV
jgi:hypothetical protein